MSVLGFGEIMMRIAPEGRLRFRQAMPGKVEITFAGAEANVCASLALFGTPARLVTALPRHAIAECLLADLRKLGVDTRYILQTDHGRLGIYFLETGANQRSSNVIYDREASSIGLAKPEAFDFAGALAGVQWVHVSGITPALSENAFAATRALLALAQSRAIPVSCDLNFRKKLWRWKPGTAPETLARESMTALLPFIDLVIANEEDAKDVLGIEAEGTAIEAGQINAAAYTTVARTIVQQFPNVKHVAITLRESISADHNNWSAMLFSAAADTAWFAPLNAHGRYEPYPIRNIVDRVGGGDSFAAGLIHALLCADLHEPSTALRFAVAASCLKHSIRGDFNFVTRDEVLALMKGSASGRVRR